MSKRKPWIPKGFVDIGEASRKLGVSDKTVRRRIEREELPAQKADSPYGSVWIIPESSINMANEIVDVVKYNNEVELKEFGLLMSNVVSNQLKEDLSLLINNLRQEIRQEVRHEVKAELEEFQNKFFEQQEANNKILLMKTEELRKPKSFWQRLLGK